MIMQFKDIKQNYPVYILDKQNVSYMQGKVTSISLPHMDNSNPMVMGKSVVDVTIEADGKGATYTMPEDKSMVYAGSVVLATDKESIIREVEAMKASAEQAIANIEKQKEIAKKSNQLLTELNPIFREKQENEKRMTKMESCIQDMGSSIEELKNMFAGLMKKMDK